MSQQGNTPLPVITVADVTEDATSLLITHQMVASSYTRLSSQRINTDKLIHELCLDQFARRKYRRTMLASTINPATGMVIPVGTLRIVLGDTSDSSKPPLEVMTLMNCKRGWKSIGIDPSDAVEFGRLAFAQDLDPNQPKQVHAMTRITRSLVEYAATLSMQELRRSQIWAVMSSAANKLFRAAKTDWALVAGVAPDHALHADLFGRFDRYWIQGRPQLYRYEGLV